MLGSLGFPIRGRLPLSPLTRPMRNTTRRTTNDARALLGEENTRQYPKSLTQESIQVALPVLDGTKALCVLAALFRLSGPIVDNIVFFDRFICHPPLVDHA